MRNSIDASIILEAENIIIDDESISNEAKLLYITALIHMDDDGVFNKDDVFKKLNYGSHRRQKAPKELDCSGYIERWQDNSYGMFGKGMCRVILPTDEASFRVKKTPERVWAVNQRHKDCDPLIKLASIGQSIRNREESALVSMPYVENQCTHKTKQSINKSINKNPFEENIDLNDFNDSFSLCVHRKSAHGDKRGSESYARLRDAVEAASDISMKNITDDKARGIFDSVLPYCTERGFVDDQFALCRPVIDKICGMFSIDAVVLAIRCLADRIGMVKKRPSYWFKDFFDDIAMEAEAISCGRSFV